MDNDKMLSKLVRILRWLALCSVFLFFMFWRSNSIVNSIEIYNYKQLGDYDERHLDQGAAQTLSQCPDPRCMSDCSSSFLLEDHKQLQVAVGESQLSWDMSELNVMRVGVLAFGKCKVVKEHNFTLDVKHRDNLKANISRAKQAIEEYQPGTIMVAAINKMRLIMVHQIFDKFDHRIQDGYKINATMKQGALVVFVWSQSFPHFQQSAPMHRDIFPSWSFSFIIGQPITPNLENMTLAEVDSTHQEVLAGTGWQPSGCTARWRLAVIVPYRNRERHLTTFLNNLIPFLQNQYIAFHVYVVNQAGDELFNRASLLNIGYMHAKERGRYDCYLFSDVDYVAENTCNVYACDSMPRHLPYTQSKHDYKVFYNGYFGGCSILNDDHMAAINGFPNEFYGWGGEDDHIYKRLVDSGYQVVHYPSHLSRYHNLYHVPKEGNPDSGRSIGVSQSITSFKHLDGLSSLNYTVLTTHHHQLYTNISVHIPGPTTVEEAEQWFKNKSIKFVNNRFNL